MNQPNPADYLDDRDFWIAYEQLQAYHDALRSHDWSFEYSDDHSVWQRGRAQLGELQHLQKQCDPDFTIWNRFAPSGYQRKISK